MNYALKLENVCKTYEMSDFVLDNVSFAVPMGSVMGFVGENGAGKTTTIGCILNTLFRNSGSIQIFEKENLTFHRSCIHYQVSKHNSFYSSSI